jgi:hypothetical protein
MIAAAIVGMSGMLEAAGICSAFGGIFQNLAAAQSEARRLRDKAARVSPMRDPRSQRETAVYAHLNRTFTHSTKVRRS